MAGALRELLAGVREELTLHDSYAAVRALCSWGAAGGTVWRRDVGCGVTVPALPLPTTAQRARRCANTALLCLAPGPNRPPGRSGAWT